jgi:cohesin loading factor subunit SCC2
MTQEPSAEIMDAIFNTDDEEGHCRLLKIMQNFLISESEKHTAKEKGSLLFGLLSHSADLP